MLLQAFIDARGISAGQIAVIKDKPANAVGVAGRVGGCDDASLAKSDERKAPKTRGIDHCFEIADPCVKAKIIHVTVRQARPARVIANERASLGKHLKPVAPNCAIPVQFEMRKPICCPNQRRTVAGLGKGYSYSVMPGAELYPLLHLV